MKAGMEIKLNLKIKLPTIPNYIRLKNSDTPIHISFFKKEELEQIGKLWTQELIKKAGRQ